MIVRNFLQWVRTAPAGERADATAALARAYLYSDLSPDDLGAAEGAMLMLLDDPSPLVRRSLADALAASPDAPPARSCWRSPPTSGRSRRRSTRCRHSSSMPIWWMRWQPAGPRFRPRSQAAPLCHVRSAP